MTALHTLLPALSGLGTGLALIVAIGVQNTYLLRLAVSARLRVVAAAVVVCAASDAALIVAGVLGVGVVVERFPVALVVVRLVGAAFLVTYGVLAARRALRPTGDVMRVAEDGDSVPVPVAVGLEARADLAGQVAEPAAQPAEPAGRAGTVPPGRNEPEGRGGRDTRRQTAGVSMRTAVLTMLVFTWANPHVYLDTLVFLGAVGNQQGIDDRWWWTAGAIAASCLWFGALGFGGRLLRPLFARPVTWRVFDGLVAVVMLGFGASLALGV
ncbi:LysE family transporter [Curtobacterium sp. ISL-83]|uniref:LysE/ArgO family amino acid transporter n=1 Tax=Curtobacterium sp. ISL-83 TaxID=2819145 RepID=UPI001BE90020|nr:LysE family transporter [Curtobacterium sp. ISL-83]MBT2502016.1 LysE family transporter [Curtobacterium sp. ISL-83]